MLEEIRLVAEKWLYRAKLIKKLKISLKEIGRPSDYFSKDEWSDIASKIQEFEEKN